MKRIARFERVSEGNGGITEEELYNLKLPKRATKGSAGYDFFATKDIELKPGETEKIATGVRCFIEEGYVLELYPRSGQGFKTKVQLYNTVGIVDSDYYNSDNEGHIFVKLYNDSPENKTLVIKKGEAFCQGIFKEFFITQDDIAEEERNGGFGSTT